MECDIRFHFEFFPAQYGIKYCCISIGSKAQVSRVKAMGMQIGILDKDGIVVVDGIVFTDMIKRIFIPVNQMPDGIEKFRYDVFISGCKNGCFGLVFKKMFFGQVIELKIQILIRLYFKLVEFCVQKDFNPAFVVQMFVIKTFVYRIDQFLVYAFIQTVLARKYFFL